MNKWEGIGRLTNDPEIKYTNDGKSIARFTMACDRKSKREGQPTADFISCVAFGKTAEVIEKYFKKGNKIAVIGTIQTGSYTNKDNQKVYTTDIIAEEIEFVESKGNSAPSAAPSKPSSDFVNITDSISDEELPFD